MTKPANQDFIPRDGAQRFRNEDGTWVCSNPGDPLFSTVTMMATEYYSYNRWKPIFEENSNDNN